jgi:hypothetical protein
VTGIGETKTNETKQRFPSRITTANRTKNHEVKTGWRSKTRSCHCCQNTKSPRQRAAQRPKSGKNLAPLAPTLTRNRRRAKRQRPTKKSRAGTGRHGESKMGARPLLEQKKNNPFERTETKLGRISRSGETHAMNKITGASQIDSKRQEPRL